MPGNEITLKDLYEKLVKIEVLLSQKQELVSSAIIIDKDSPFWDEDKQVYDMGFYRRNHPKEDEGERK